MPEAAYAAQPVPTRSSTRPLSATSTSRRPRRQRFDYRIAERRSELLKRDEVPATTGPRYEVTRLEAAAADSAGYRSRSSTAGWRSTAQPGAAARYGATAFPGGRFRSQPDQLLERGFVVAIAHVRGGGDLGKPWARQGAWRQDEHFHDFVACARSWCGGGTPRPSAGDHRGSAGGLLMGAVTNLRRTCSGGAHLRAVRDSQHHVRRFAAAHRGRVEEWGNPEIPSSAWMPPTVVENVRALLPGDARAHLVLGQPGDVLGAGQ